jgi:hypothetical protein
MTAQTQVPEMVLPILQSALTVEYTSLTRAGRPIMVPVTPYAEPARRHPGRVHRADLPGQGQRPTVGPGPARPAAGPPGWTPRPTGARRPGRPRGWTSGTWPGSAQTAFRWPSRWRAWSSQGRASGCGSAPTCRRRPPARPA